MVLRPFSCSKAELKLLTDAVGEMPKLKYDFQGATTIFFHLHNFYRFSADEIEELDTAIIAKDAIKLQEACYKCVEGYFGIEIPPYVEGDSLQAFLRTFLESSTG